MSENNKLVVRLRQDEAAADAVLLYLSQFSNKLVVDSIEEEDINSNYHIEYRSETDSENEDSSKTNTLKKSIKSLKYLIDYGIYNIKYKNYNLSILYEVISDPIGLMDTIDRLEKLEISINLEGSLDRSTALKIIEDFILMTDKKKLPKKENKISIYIAEEGFWKFLSNIPKRKKESVFHSKKMHIFNDLDIFNNSEQEYSNHGIPYKRNYLFHGPPGTGKTSMLTTIASEFNTNLYMINFSSRITDANFMRLISKIPSGSIMVLEDIDALFCERISNDIGNKSMVSFSAILNSLDGIARKNKMITIMTTNYIDRLDEALIRPGRIDEIIKFEFADSNQIKEMYESYFGKNQVNIYNKLKKNINSKKISTASLQKFFFENRNNINTLLENIDLLNNLENQYKKTCPQMYS